ncbi:MAG: hypothetical protein DWQ02_08115 [Bacteroidetes bacterium]|nr:MAG: hypothetical protein DWQ02_08115 [Bacteroidota bacterium]
MNKNPIVDEYLEKKMKSPFYLIVFLCFLTNLPLKGQNTKMPVSIGYFAPYGVQYGAKAGISIPWKNWESDRKEDQIRSYNLTLDPQIGYFVFPEVQNNFFLNMELAIRSHKNEKRFSPMASAGLGYLLGLQKQEGSVNLATGEIDFETTALHYFVPTVSLGFNIKPKKSMGYYFKGFFGRKIIRGLEGSTIIGAEAGITFNINQKN